jgi:hypothetical protein
VRECDAAISIKNSKFHKYMIVCVCVCVRMCVCACVYFSIKMTCEFVMPAIITSKEYRFTPMILQFELI